LNEHTPLLLRKPKLNFLYLAKSDARTIGIRWTRQDCAKVSFPSSVKSKCFTLLTSDCRIAYCLYLGGTKLAGISDDVLESARFGTTNTISIIHLPSQQPRWLL
jgi:hypothetical protein